MMRFARVASIVAAALVAVGVEARAQTPSAATPDSTKFFVGVDAGATFGHKSSGFVGGEVGFVVTPMFSVVIEGGRMSNIGTDDLDANANKIAANVKATADASYRINFADIGIRVTPPMANLPVRPYLGVGFGVAEARATTVFLVNGTVTAPETLGIQLGNDLNGAVKKPLIVINGGLIYPLGKQYYVDGSFRYGRVLPKNDDPNQNDTGINTMRAQIGVGVRF
jgi:hypothetical protein